MQLGWIPVTVTFLDIAASYRGIPYAGIFFFLFALELGFPLCTEMFYIITQWSCSASGSLWEMRSSPPPGPLAQMSGELKMSLHFSSEPPHLQRATTFPMSHHISNEPPHLQRATTSPTSHRISKMFPSTLQGQLDVRGGRGGGRPIHDSVDSCYRHVEWDAINSLQIYGIIQAPKRRMNKKVLFVWSSFPTFRRTRIQLGKQEERIYI